MNSQAFFQQTTNAIAQYLWQELTLKPGVHYRFAQKAQGGPRVLSLSIFVNPRYANKIAAMNEQLSMAAQLDKDSTIRIGRGHRGCLSIEIPKPPDLWYNVSLDSLPRRRGLKATVGLDGEHRPALVNFANPLTPHALLAGATGSGKTNCLKLLTYDLVSQNDPGAVEFILIDTRKRGANWKDFASIPHLGHPVITDDQTALRALSWACAEIDRRAISGKDKPHIFIGVDEAQNLLDKPEFVKVIGDISAVGREFHVSLLAAMQDPTQRQLGDTSIKRNLTCRLVGKVDSATAAHVATGQKESGAELLAGAGDMLLVQPQGITRLTACLLSSKETDKLPRIENVRSLDLSQYEDADRVLNQTKGRGREAEPLEPAHVALALTAGKGITWLAQRLGIGSGRAKKVLKFAKELHTELAELGHTVIPRTESIPVSGRWATD